MKASDSDPKLRCGAFAVGKDELRDRQIINPVPINAMSWNISDDSSYIHMVMNETIEGVACRSLDEWAADGHVQSGVNNLHLHT